jgi:cyclopropane-fatty-acyl-phospholipid synthase
LSNVALPAEHASDRRRRQAVQEILGSVDVRIDGARPCDIQVQDERFFGRVLRAGALGLGESYMEEWWRAECIDELFYRLAQLDRRNIPIPLSMKWLFSKDHFINLQSRARAHGIAEHHYDLGNDLFQAMLDPRMAYSCGYWKHATTLADAQEAKLDLVCRKLNLKPGQVVLDIGCGWGSFVKYAVEKYDVVAVGVTVSSEQAALGRELCAGLPIELRVQDYREVADRFDHVVSIGMFEHVGTRNYRTFFEVAHRCLKDDGRFLFHTIGKNSAGRPVDAWIEKYIFPNSAQPAISDIGTAIEGLFVMEDWQNFGADYDPTLMAWFANFDHAWHRLHAHYDATFYRMWKYFLLSCAGSFRARHNNVWQVLLSKRGVPGGYRLT